MKNAHTSIQGQPEHSGISLRNGFSAYAAVSPAANLSVAAGLIAGRPNSGKIDDWAPSSTTLKCRGTLIEIRSGQTHPVRISNGGDNCPANQHFNHCKRLKPET
jgi:hypothetical protein